MDRRFRYHARHVVDIPVGDSAVRVWNPGRDVDRREIERTFAPLFRASFVAPYVALMPDFHPGPGAMIGSVVPARRVILPAVIGGDLGCGMTAVCLPVSAERLREDLDRLRDAIAAAVPTGTDHNAQVTDRVAANPIWARDTRARLLTSRVRRKLMRQFASLGGGNHFIELQEDDNGQAWVMLHTGSRHVGVLVRDYYVERGAGQPDADRRKYAAVPHLPVEGSLAADYLADHAYAVDFARASRREILLRILEELSALVPEADVALANEAIDVAHNTIRAEEHWGETLYVHRKGATPAGRGEVGLIPGSMGTRSFVIEGRGNEYAFSSCSHGAGRALSRAAALATITEEGFRESMAGIVYRHDARMRDEAPAAYKDVRRVMRAQRDLVKVRHTLRPLLVIKGR